jgi:protease-4
MSNDNDQSNQAQAWQASRAAAGKEGWEREVLDKLAFATLREQRARGRCGILL